MFPDLFRMMKTELCPGANANNQCDNNTDNRLINEQ